MQLSKETLVQLKYGLENVNVQPAHDYYPIVVDTLQDIGTILGPLCSHCTSAEVAMDIIDPTGTAVTWWYLVQVSCRCTKTLKEQVTAQVYLDKNGVMEKVEDKERYYSKIMHKLCCPHYPMQKQEAQPQPQQS